MKAIIMAIKSYTFVARIVTLITTIAMGDNIEDGGTSSKPVALAHFDSSMAHELSSLGVVIVEVGLMSLTWSNEQQVLGGEFGEAQHEVRSLTGMKSRIVAK